MSFEIISNDPKEALIQYQGWKNDLEKKLREPEFKGNIILIKILLSYCRNIRSLENQIKELTELKPMTSFEDAFKKGFDKK